MEWEIYYVGLKSTIELLNFVSRTLYYAASISMLHRSQNNQVGYNMSQETFVKKIKLTDGQSNFSMLIHRSGICHLRVDVTSLPFWQLYHECMVMGFEQRM